MTEPFVPPAWLGKTPFGSFSEYGDGSLHAWQVIVKPDRALCTAHEQALQGDPEALDLMRRFYLALTTKRLKS